MGRRTLRRMAAASKPSNSLGKANARSLAHFDSRIGQFLLFVANSMRLHVRFVYIFIVSPFYIILNLHLSRSRKDMCNMIFCVDLDCL